MAAIEHTPTSASAVPADRRKASGEGRVGGPCHAVKGDGYFCPARAVVVADDGYGYCKRHAPSQGAS